MSSQKLERERALRPDQQRSGSDVPLAQGGPLGDRHLLDPAAGARPRFISVCAGIGGFDAGLERAGWSCVGQVEIDPFCNRVRAKHWPRVPQHGDLLTFHAERGAAELVCGGTPCQDLSVAGKRAGLDGPRSRLFYEFVRVADECDADLLFENVPGLLSSNKGEDFAVVIREITGFRPAVPADGWRNSGVAVGPKRFAAWRVLDARHFGVPQRRRRVFVVGSSRAERALSLFPECPCCGWDLEAGGEARAGAADAAAPGVVGTLQGRGNRLGADEAGGTASTLRAQSNASHREDSYTYIPLVAGGLTQRDRKGPRFDHAEPNVVAHTLRASGFDASEDGTMYTLDRDSKHAVAVVSDMTVVPYTIHAAESMAKERHAFETDTARSLDTTGGFASGQGGTLVLSPSVRRLTPTECERLQGFPDGWTASDGEGQYALQRNGKWRLVAGTPDGPRYAAIGNAVAVPCAEWIGRQLIAAREKQ